MDKKIKVSLAIALVIGLVATYFGMDSMNRYQEEQLQLVPVVVSKVDIRADTKLTRDNIEIRNVSAKFVDESTATELEEVLDKIATVPIFEGKPIDLRNIQDRPKQELGNRSEIGVYVDSARSGGVEAGDIVDVYWIHGGELAQPASLIASNVRVWKVLNDKGEEINNIGISAAVKNNNPRIVYLMVKSEEIPYVIQGAYSGNNNIALAKKDGETKVEVVNMDAGGEDSGDGI